MKIYVVVWTIAGASRIPAAYTNYEDAENHIKQMERNMIQGVYRIHEVIVSV